MGLINTFSGAVEGVLADQWREYFYCDSMSEKVLVIKGYKRVTGRSSNTKGESNIISNGSIISINEGQCMIIVEQGKVVEVCAEPGEFLYDTSTEPSIFYGGLGEGIKKSFLNVGKRFTFGGDTAKDQRIYYINTKELIGNKYGTQSPVPFRVIDNNIGLDMDISVRCHGEYSYKIVDPLLFYTNVCGNVTSAYHRSEIDSQLKTELMTALQPAFAKISSMGVRYSALPGHTIELSDAINDVLSSKWGELRGIKLVSLGISSIKASEEDEAAIKEIQRNATFRNTDMAAAHIVSAQAKAMQDAAKNENAGVFAAFAGVNMANNSGGMRPENLYAMANNKTEEKKDSNVWTCSCGTENKGKFCTECANPKPIEITWTCSCGVINKGKFCFECGKAKDTRVIAYKCNKCGWEPENSTKPPKYCPECGDSFDENDIVRKD